MLDEMPTDIVERFAERLKEMRTRKNLTQVALSEKIGIQTTYLSDWKMRRKSRVCE